MLYKTKEKNGKKKPQMINSNGMLKRDARWKYKSNNYENKNTDQFE